MDPLPDDSSSMSCELKDRLRELDFANTSFMIANPDATPYDTLVHITNSLPQYFPDPEHTCARVTIGPLVIETGNYKPSVLRIEAPVITGGASLGILEAGYVGGVSHEAFPFTDDHTKFLKAMADRIGIIARTHILEDLPRTVGAKVGTLLDNALVGITQSTLSGELIYANAKAVAMFGFESLKEAMAAGILSRYRNPRDRETLIQTLQETGRVAGCETEFITRSGDPIVVLFSATLEGDVITGMMMVITDRKHGEEEIIKSEKRLAEAQRVVRMGSWEWDVATGNLSWSENTYRMFGFLPREFAVTYNAFLGCVHPEDRPAVDEAVKQSLSDPKITYSVEHRIVLPDGSMRWVHERGEVTFDGKGSPVRMINHY